MLYDAIKNEENSSMGDHERISHLNEQIIAVCQISVLHSLFKQKIFALSPNSLL